MNLGFEIWDLMLKIRTNMITEILTVDIALYILIAYLLGSIPTAVWIGKIFYKVDVRKQGSGSAGATNTIRVLGLKAGIPVLIFDAFKGWLAVFIASNSKILLAEDYFAFFLVVVAMVAVLGHVFPLFAGFKGGKGVATLLGIAIALFPYTIIILVGIFIIVFISTRYVSLSSITASVCFPFVNYFIIGTHEIAYLIFSVIVALFVPLTHIKNIKRLIKGEENKIYF